MVQWVELGWVGLVRYGRLRQGKARQGQARLGSIISIGTTHSNSIDSVTLIYFTHPHLPSLTSISLSRLDFRGAWLDFLAGTVAGSLAYLGHQSGQR